jgi:hypothetical protein
VRLRCSYAYAGDYLEPIGAPSLPDRGRSGIVLTIGQYH